MAIREELARIGEEMQAQLKEARSTQALEQLRVSVLGKKGSLTALLRGMGSLPPQERPAMGQVINEHREKLTAMLDERLNELRAREKEARLEKERVDITEPRDLPKIGQIHPCQMALRQVLDCFTGMGFEVVEGPEIELDHYNFELLNLPKNHPARDAQDTFYLDDNIVLRTQRTAAESNTI